MALFRKILDTLKFGGPRTYYIFGFLYTLSGLTASKYKCLPEEQSSKC